jgi:phosphatidylglycerol:prolipoprotein diacylglycerol transferase
VAAAALVGLWLSSRLASEGGLDSDAISSLGQSCVIAALVGAKLMMFLNDLHYYMANPREIFSLSTLQAGGVFYGGFIAAFAVAAWYMRKRRLPPLATADVFAPAIALGHAIGRLGCFSAGCCWGRETHVAWAVTFRDPVANLTTGVPLGISLHPTQLYESFAEFIIAAILIRNFRRAHRPGDIISLYLALYGAVRFAVEYVRYHEQVNPFGPFDTSQWISLGLFFIGVAHFAAAKLRAPVTPGPAAS